MRSDRRRGRVPLSRPQCHWFIRQQYTMQSTMLLTIDLNFIPVVELPRVEVGQLLQEHTQPTNLLWICTLRNYKL